MEHNIKPYSREVVGKTPHGGVKMVAFFFDKNGNPCIEQDAAVVLIYEYDKEGNVIFSARGDK